MKYLSLFSGIGGFELGIQQAYEENNESNGDTIEPKEQSEKCSLSDTGVSTDTSTINGNRGRASSTCVDQSDQKTKDKQEYETISNEVELGRQRQKESKLEANVSEPMCKSKFRLHPTCIGYSENPNESPNIVLLS